MSINEIAFLLLAIGALTLLAGVLGWASWMESRGKKASRVRGEYGSGTSSGQSHKG